MKARPILFNGYMVRALLDGRKTQTRRIVKPQPPDDHEVPHQRSGGLWVTTDNNPPHVLMDYPMTCPFGVPDDLLWVRETFADTLGMGFDKRIHFAADTEPGSDADEPARHTWKPSIHMPRWASRLTLRVTDVRVGRVQDISEEDAMAEGVSADLRNGEVYGTAKDVFSKLWEDINGPDSWSDNPWVWVVDFSVHECNVDSFENMNLALEGG